MRDRDRASRRWGWGTWLLVAVCALAVAGAVLLVGPPGAAPGASERIVTVARGVVQSTISGSGTVAAAQQLDVDFASSGTLTHVYVHPGQHVAEGQLLAEVDSHDAQLQLDAAEASLAAAEAGGSSSRSASASSAATTATADAASAPASSAAAPTRTTPATDRTTPQTTTTPAAAQPGQRGAANGGSGASGGGSGASGSSTGGRAGGGTSTGGSSGTSSGSGTSNAQSAAQRAASIASAQAAVDQAEAALAATRLTAPITGTVAQVNAQAGERVGGGGTSGAAASSGSGGSGGGSGGGGGGGGSGSGSSASNGSSSSSSAFIVLASLDALKLVVPFSESDVGKLRVGQPATVTANALPGDELAAHVVSIATLPTSNGGVVSYDVTFRLDQLAHGLKVGMTASAQVVVAQAGGAVNVASAAISRRGGGAIVTLVRGAQRVQQPVVTGIVGDTTTQVVSGLKAGDRVAIAVAAPTGLGGLAGQGGGRLGGGGGFGGRRFGGGGGGGGFAIGVGPGGGP